MGDEEQLDAERVFAGLKPFSIDLLDLLQNPKRKRSASAPFLLELASFLRRAPAPALQLCLDYTLFPLLLLLDAAVKCRSGKTVDAAAGEKLGGLEVSDGVAEGVLVCIEALLRKCHLGSINQMVMILKKLTAGAMLPHTNASEEFRLGIVRSFKAMLLRMQPCSDSHCSCRNSVIPQTAVDITRLDVNYTNSILYNSTDCKECLLAFLQSPDASAAVGHWLSLLLGIAEVEASRGHRGSSELRKEALLSLRVLIAKIGIADALAFFLPGIVSRVSKSLYVSKTMISGASGSSVALEQAILGLVESLIMVLSDKGTLQDESRPSNMDIDASAESVLDMLRSMPTSLQKENRESDACFVHQSIREDMRGSKSFVVKRTKEWIHETAANVDKMLSATFPHLCAHQSEKVRKTLVDGIRGLLCFCSSTLSSSKLLLLECLCLLACDDSVTVSKAAGEALVSLFSGESFLTEGEISDIFTRLVDKLPRIVLRSDELAAVSHARKLLALLFYAGPDFLANRLISSPTNATRFFDCLTLSMSPNSQFSGSFDRLMITKPLSAGYLLSVAELKSAPRFNEISYNNITYEGAPVVTIVNSCSGGASYVLPHVPPWFIGSNSEKLYHALSGILRLVGRSANVFSPGESGSANLTILVDILLEQFRNLLSQLRTKDFNQEELYISRLGQLVRETSASVCTLNEMLYGVSDQAFDSSFIFFHGAKEIVTTDWHVKEGKDNSKERIIQCIGNVLHEYTAHEVWELPVSERGELDFFPLRLFRDVKALHQVILEGIGVFGMILGKDFADSGFVHSSLYLLLRKLISSSSEIRITSDAVLKCLSVSSGYTSVGSFVVSNADYIVDSLCRELRHLDINPHVPNVLSSMLSYIGAAHDILPLLEEPVRAVSLELEVLGRNKHPHLTVPFLKAVNEIAKSCRCEALELPSKAKSFFDSLNAEVCAIENLNMSTHSKFEKTDAFEKEYTALEYWEDKMCNLNETRRYRRIIGSLAGSCLLAAIPLLSSLSEPACLVSLDIVENAVASVANVEAAFKHEKESKAGITKAIDLLSMMELEEREEDESDENRLLPAMNKLWPYLIICLRNKISVAVVKKCTKVLSKSVEISGGGFFTRRFHTDGFAIWKLLTLSPFHRKSNPSTTDNKTLILLPYRAHPNSEQPMAEISSQKIQIAVLEMISDLSSNKKSAVALESVLKRVAGLAVSIACSTMTGLRKSALKALVGLSNIDSDLIWLLVADVYYSVYKKNAPVKSDLGLCGIGELLPPPVTSNEYLYVQYSGESVGFDLDPRAVEFVFKALQEGTIEGVHCT